MFIGILARELTKQGSIDDTLIPLWDNDIFLDINSEDWSLLYKYAEKELGNNFHIVSCDKVKGRHRDSFEYGRDKTDNFKHIEPIGALWYVEDEDNIYVGNIECSDKEVLMAPEGKRKEKYITDKLISEEMVKYLKETHPDKKILIDPHHDFLKDYVMFNDNVEFMDENTSKDALITLYSDMIDSLGSENINPIILEEITKYISEHTDNIEKGNDI